jgi:membrane protease YdiL (CAAX protease family)
MEVVGIVLYPQKMDMGFPKGAYHLAIGFFVTMFILVGIRGFISPSNEPLLWYMIYYGLAVGPAEEIVFRGSLPHIIGDVPSQLLFGVFHLFVYSLAGNILINIGFAVLCGFGLLIVKKRFGIEMAIGMHSAFDLVNGGIL